MDDPSFVLGIDVGGTNTDAVLLRLRRRRRGPAAPDDAAVPDDAAAPDGIVGGDGDDGSSSSRSSGGVGGGVGTTGPSTRKGDDRRSPQWIELLRASKSTSTFPDPTWGIVQAVRTLFDDDGSDGDDRDDRDDDGNKEEEEPKISPQRIRTAFVGTTVLLNAILEGRGLNRVAVVRLCSPGGRGVEPLEDFPPSLRDVICTGTYYAQGGLRFDGRESMSIDARELECIARQIAMGGEEKEDNKEGEGEDEDDDECDAGQGENEGDRKMKGGRWRHKTTNTTKTDAVVVSSTFGPIDSSTPTTQEERACDILCRHLPPTVRVLAASSASSGGGGGNRLGILAREHGAVLSASLHSVSSRAAASIRRALRVAGVPSAARVYLTGNDGSVVGLREVTGDPLKCVSCGPANSLIGAAFLANNGRCGEDDDGDGGLAIKGCDEANNDDDEDNRDRIVLDVGGTSTDAGCMISGAHPRRSNAESYVAGDVRINRRTIDVVSIALGGGSIVTTETTAATAAATALGEKKEVSEGGLRKGDVAVRVGPESVGADLTTRALCFVDGNRSDGDGISIGGDDGDGRRVCTATCIAVCKGAMKVAPDDGDQDQNGEGWRWRRRRHRHRRHRRHPRGDDTGTAIGEPKESDSEKSSTAPEPNLPTKSIGDLNLPSSLVDAAWDVMQRRFRDLVEKARTDDRPVDVLVVGGAAGLVDADRLASSLGKGCRVMIPPWSSVANACGSALAKNAAEIEAVVDFASRNREEALSEFRQKACELAGPHADVTECEEVPLAYLPGKVTRVFVRSVAPMDLLGPSIGAEDGSDTGTDLVESSADARTMDVVESPPALRRPDPPPVQPMDPVVRDGVWFPSEYDAHCLAVGCGILGCGGGGSTRKNLLQLLRSLREGKSVRIVSPRSVPDDALVAPCSFMGAPTVGLERIGGAEELVAAVMHNLRTTSSPHGDADGAAKFITVDEVGGSNGLAPLIVGGILDLPVVDSDLMGRAFPELQHCTSAIYGLPQTPMTAADEFGRCVTLHAPLVPSALPPQDELTFVERVLRPVCVEFGCSAALSSPLLRGADLRRVGVLGSLSRARRIGDCILRGSHPCESVDAVLKMEGGRLIVEGKVADVQRETTAGFARGRFTVVGAKGPSTVVEFQNEFLVARRFAPDDKSIESVVDGCVPDLICLVDADSARPIATEEIKYGLRVCVLLLPASSLLLTPEALHVVGPTSFGLNVSSYERNLSVVVSDASICDSP